ncbi:MAG: hypothetical protein K0R82_1557 [Flavipsychrobacter sp.]|jgi:uncharacterized protein YndB with AHSA1/START domain|nr:hypothetical protein [Flavipsychrobacter sp.]
MDTELFSIAPDCEIVSSRVFHNSPDAVFQAWADPALLAKWWGPAGFTNTFYEFDPRPGGRWRFTMHGPDKGHYQNECVFLKIERPTLIAWDRISKPLFRVVATFDETDDGATQLVFRMQFASKGECDKIRGFAPAKNEENFDKLEVVLSSLEMSRTEQ